MLRSNDKLLFKEPKCNRSWGDRSFYAAATQLWNQLPYKLKTSCSVAAFKKGLKTHLMQIAYN